MRLVVRVRAGGDARTGRLEDGRIDVLDHDEPLRALAGEGTVVETLAAADARLLAPIEAPEIWCAGVTYERSRDARLEEAETDARDVYSLVYEAERPELFLKDAAMRRTAGPGEPIRVRSDSRWVVPEPELGVVLGEGGEPVALTVGNDVSCRDIEGENPLYLPQAKVFGGACAIGPALAVPDDWSAPLTIRLRIAGADGAELYAGETSTGRMRRTPLELVDWLLRENPVPAGSVLLTGTGLVPPGEFTLAPGHVVEVEIDGIGVLRNPVAG
ncbi:MAG TPA: fumarylacetoacetate hydrolase family protein [Gaiellaceae bacterium]|nr:fumarylacetoacetate hydrolase family protein [Gaiellaceae bacterium]